MEGEEEVKAELVSMTLGHQIAEARQLKELTQAQLAKAINEKVGIIVGFENGSAVYDNNVVIKLEKYFNTHLERGRPKKKKAPKKK